MRISDWSSDVSSSDLAKIKLLPLVTFGNAAAAYYPGIDRHFTIQYVKTTCQNQVLRVIVFIDLQNIVARYQGLQDRKSVVQGKSVSVRLELGGRRLIKKHT